MALERCARSSTVPTEYPTGSVVFDTTLPPGVVCTYHAMLLWPGSTRTTGDGRVEVPVCDMTMDGIQWPEANAWHTLHEDCYVGHFPELDREQMREVIEELRAMRRDPEVAGAPEVYTLACHGVREPSPNDPVRFLPGIRCSCASLIEHCYEEVGGGLDLVEENAVPVVDAAELWRVLTQGALPRPGFAAILERLGLKGPGPWPVLLPAYQMHAFADGTANLPRHPRLEDHPFRPPTLRIAPPAPTLFPEPDR